MTDWTCYGHWYVLLVLHYGHPPELVCVYCGSSKTPPSVVRLDHGPPELPELRPHVQNGQQEEHVPGV